LTARLQKNKVSEKMIEDDLRRVEESATKSTYRLGVGFERCEDKGEKSALMFVPSSIYHKEEEAFKPTKTHYPSNPKPSVSLKREVRKETPSQERKLSFACFVAVLVTWKSFASSARELRRCTLSMLETHIVMSLLIFCLVLILVFRLVLTLMLRLTLLLMLYHSSVMGLTIPHMVLVHERTTLCLDTMVTTNVLIVVIVPRVGPVFPQECFTPVLSRDTWTVHVFPIVVLVPLVQMAMCKRL
jgi:hypothetical protein